LNARLIKQLRRNSVNLFVLTCLARAPPLLSVLSRNPGFLTVHHTRFIDIIMLFAAAVLVPSAFLLGAEFVVGLGSLRAGQILHGILVSLLSAVACLIVLKNIFPHGGWSLLLGALGLGAGFGFFYLRSIRDRISLAILSPVILLFPLTFFAQRTIRRVLVPARPTVQRTRATTPVVMVIFDEFPLSSLLTSEEEIDARYFPHFSVLAHEATWFRNATAVSDYTLDAVPAILDGNRPDPQHSRLPNAADHPRSLFTLLGAYRMNVHETVTHVCPDSLCPPDAQQTFVSRLKLLASDTTVVALYAILPEKFTHRLPDIDQGL